MIDPNITGSYENFLRRTCAQVVKVEERDDTGGFLKTRLAKVEELCRTLPHAFWTNQYGNPDNTDAHYNTTGLEICNAFEGKSLDYVFLGVSSGGTISGVSKRVKQHFPNAKIIAVDAVGSVIFGGPPKKRYIPGIGSSIVPPLVSKAMIDRGDPHPGAGHRHRLSGAALPPRPLRGRFVRHGLRGDPARGAQTPERDEPAQRGLPLRGPRLGVPGHGL